MSLTLQRSLLPKALPKVDGVEFAARYIPGESGIEVGGDWYSAIAVDNHRFVFVVGDVSGRGLAAATIMAGLRYKFVPMQQLATAQPGFLIWQRKKSISTRMGTLPPFSSASSTTNAAKLPWPMRVIYRHCFSTVTRASSSKGRSAHHSESEHHHMSR